MIKDNKRGGTGEIIGFFILFAILSFSIMVYAFMSSNIAESETITDDLTATKIVNDSLHDVEKVASINLPIIAILIGVIILIVLAVMIVKAGKSVGSA